MNKTVFFIAIMFSCFAGIGQNLDSLISREKDYVKEDSFRLNLLLEISGQLRIKQPQKALTYAERSVPLAEKLGYNHLTAKSYSMKARLVKGEEGLIFFHKSIGLLKKENDLNGLAFAYMELGFLYSQMERTAKSLESYFQSLDYYKKLGNPPRAAIAYSNIGLIYVSVNDPKAIDYLEKSIALMPLPADSGRIINALINLGAAYMQYGMRIKSIEVLEKAMSASKNANRWREVFTSLNNLSHCYLKLSPEEQKELHLSEKNCIEKAKNYSETALDIWMRNKIPVAPVSIYANLAKISLIKNQPGETITWLRMLKHLIDSTKKDQLYWDYYSQLSNYYEQVKKYDSALLYNRIALDWKDSLRKNEKNMEVARKEIEIDFKKTEDSLRQLQLLTNEKLINQTLITYQKEQEIALGIARLGLINKEKELAELANEKTLAELDAEQSQRKEKEKLLIISDQQRNLQANNLKLQQIQLDLKEKNIQDQKKEKFYFAGGLGLLIVFFSFLFFHIRNRQKANALLNTQILKTQRAEADRMMAEFEMHGLRAQLNPHFMFNALNAIQKQILKEENDSALKYLNNFARMLRQLLENAEHSFIPLEKELSFIRLYISMEQLRMPDLEFDLVVDPSVDTVKYTIPNMIIQPYIENAIWHGLSVKEGNKKICVNVSHKNHEIIICIEDNGIGRKGASDLKTVYRKDHKSKGMELLRKRFQLIHIEYGSEVKIEVKDLFRDGIPAGTRVALHIPESFAKPVQRIRLEPVSPN